MGRRVIVNFEEFTQISGLKVNLTVGHHEDEEGTHLYCDCKVVDGDEEYFFDYHQGTLEGDFNEWGLNAPRYRALFDKYSIPYRVS